MSRRSAKWLFQKARSKLVDRWRYYGVDRRDATHECVQELDTLRASFLSASTLAMQREDLAGLERAFAALGDEYRDVITRARLYGESHAQIAAGIGKSEGAVRMLLHRALARLAWLMRGAGADPAG